MKVIKKTIVAKIAELEQAKHEVAQLNDKIAQLQASIITQMDQMETKSVTVELEGRALKATKVQGVRIVIDEPSLKKKLGAKVWEHVTTRVLDKKKLEATIEMGEVDAMKVAECTTEVPNRPYIKLS